MKNVGGGGRSGGGEGVAPAMTCPSSAVTFACTRAGRSDVLSHDVYAGQAVCSKEKMTAVALREEAPVASVVVVAAANVAVAGGRAFALWTSTLHDVRSVVTALSDPVLHFLRAKSPFSVATATEERQVNLAFLKGMH
jgi:hypothetical protein